MLSLTPPSANSTMVRPRWLRRTSGRIAATSPERRSEIVTSIGSPIAVPMVAYQAASHAGVWNAVAAMTGNEPRSRSARPST